MALLFMDSFDHYATADVEEKWTQWCALEGTATGGQVASAVGAYGRNSTQGLRFTVNATDKTSTPVGRTVAPSGATCIIGAAVNCTGLSLLGTNADPKIKQWAPGVNGGNWLFAVRDTNLYQVWFMLNTNGTISCYRGDDSSSVLLGTSSNALQDGVWSYVEVKVLIHPSAGTVDIRIDGTSGLSLTGQNTRTSANSAWTDVRVGFLSQIAVGAITLDVDDVVIMDASGSYNNTFIGDVTISALYPNGAGTTSGWTPSAGSNYDCVNEALVNDDTDYVSTSATNTKDTYAMQDCAAGADIRAVQIVTAARKGSEGPGQIKHVIRSGGTDYDSAAIGLGGTSYSFYRSIWETDPGTGSPVGAWTESAFNAAEMGVKKTG